jgi:hypothetical protein
MTSSPTVVVHCWELFIVSFVAEQFTLDVKMLNITGVELMIWERATPGRFTGTPEHLIVEPFDAYPVLCPPANARLLTD